jgi:hypothetical protein
MTRILFLAVFTAGLSLAAVRGDEVMYVGGTAKVEEKTEGLLDLSKEGLAIFNSKKGSFEIPCAKIESLEYGQKVGRRVGAAVAVSPVLLLSKKRKHYLTLTYADAAGVKQSAVFELGKGSVRSVIGTLEKASGKKVEFESEEAKKNYEK